MLKMKDSIQLFTPEEDEKYFREQDKLFSLLLSLSDKQINYIFNSGIYNHAILGYLIQACRNAGIDAGTTQSIVRGLYRALDDISKTEAEKVEENYHYYDD
jgi:hypothetical protein